MSLKWAGLLISMLAVTVLVDSCSMAGPRAALPPSRISSTPGRPEASTALPSPAAEPSASAVRSLSEIYTTTRDALLVIQAREGSGRALDVLSRFTQSEPGVSGVCHAISHDLGYATL